MIQSLLESRWLWEALGSLLAMAVIYGVSRMRAKDVAKADRAETLLATFATSLDWQKNMVHAIGDKPGALLLRDLTRAITGGATNAGLQNHLDKFLAARDINQQPRLRHVPGVGTSTEP